MQGSRKKGHKEIRIRGGALSSGLRTVSRSLPGEASRAPKQALPSVCERADLVV